MYTHIRHSLIVLTATSLLLASCGQARRPGRQESEQPEASRTPLPVIVTLTPSPAGAATSLPTAAPAKPNPPAPTQPVSKPNVPPTSAPISPANPLPPGNPFGVIIGTGPGGQLLISQAQSLGIAYYRPLSVFLDKGGQCKECDPASSAGFKLVLTVRANGELKAPTIAPTDLNQYQTQLQAVLQRYHPTIVAIENEMNSPGFYQGTAEQYLAELKAGCQVAHSLGILCSDGALTSNLVAAVTAKNLVDTGQTNAAIDFVNNAFADSGKRASSVADIQQVFKDQADQIAFGQQLLAGYKSAGIDLVNFHWYINSAPALISAVQYLRSAVGGLPAMCNEMGQMKPDATQVTAVAREARTLGLKPIIWFSIDTGGAVGLFSNTGQLRPEGQAFREAVTQ